MYKLSHLKFSLFNWYYFIFIFHYYILRSHYCTIFESFCLFVLCVLLWMLLLLGFSMCFCDPCSLFWCICLFCVVLLYMFFPSTVLGQILFYFISYLLFLFVFGGLSLDSFKFAAMFLLLNFWSLKFPLYLYFIVLGFAPLFSGGSWSCHLLYYFSLQIMTSNCFCFFVWFLTDFYRICIAWCSSVREGAWWTQMVKRPCNFLPFHQAQVHENI